MSERVMFYVVDNPLRLCVLEPKPGRFLTFPIDTASLSRLMLEAAPYVHQALAEPIAQSAAQTPLP